jgi:hypothetical protein
LGSSTPKFYYEKHSFIFGHLLHPFSTDWSRCIHVFFALFYVCSSDTAIRILHMGLTEIIKQLIAILEKEEGEVVEEVKTNLCFLLSNICSENDNKEIIIYQKDILEFVEKCLLGGNKLAKEALCVVNNLVHTRHFRVIREVIGDEYDLLCNLFELLELEDIQILNQTLQAILCIIDPNGDSTEHREVNFFNGFQ